jgi:hypothetical protein
MKIPGESFFVFRSELVSGFSFVPDCWHRDWRGGDFLCCQGILFGIYLARGDATFTTARGSTARSVSNPLWTLKTKSTKPCLMPHASPRHCPPIRGNANDDKQTITGQKPEL